MLWSRSRPPELFPDAILTRYGWTDPITGELLVVLFSPQIGPGEGIQQTQEGAANIQATTQQQISGSAYIAARSLIGRSTTKMYMIGTARIVCQRPYYTGINPTWGS